MPESQARLPSALVTSGLFVKLTAENLSLLLVVLQTHCLDGSVEQQQLVRVSYDHIRHRDCLQSIETLFGFGEGIDPRRSGGATVRSRWLSVRTRLSKEDSRANQVKEPGCAGARAPWAAN